MNSQLFIDSLRILCSELHARTARTLTKPMPLSKKLERLSLAIVSFKKGICQSLHKLMLNKCDDHLINCLKQELKESEEKMLRLELHSILEKKIKKMKEQSMASSMLQEGFDASFVEDPFVSKLKNSMVMIERDLGITAEEEDDYNEDVSSVIHRSMASLEGTPIANRVNTTLSDSICSDSILGNENRTSENIFEFKQKELEQEKQMKKMGKRPPKKKKAATVYSSKNSGGILDNLLEESYQSCMP